KVLPFVSPIMHAARALAATLNGTPTPLSYPAMPVSVKLPACPTMVSPPDVSKMGEWSIQEDSAGVKALFENIDGDLLGFALIGEATKEKVALTARLPPLME
ncbi:MAG: FAD-dependent oxidoreductase, partial [Herbaspirillum sp.]